MSKTIEVPQQTASTANTNPLPFNLTDVDIATLAQTDEEFIPHSWEELKDIIGGCRVVSFSVLFSEETLLFVKPLLTDSIPRLTGANDLSAFKRYPSQLRRYLSWSSEIKATYGSIPNFVCEERLEWVPSRIRPHDKSSGLEPKDPTPFVDPADYKILRNDWPYATPLDIAHLVIWLKTPFAVSKPEGHLLPEGRAQIESFVNHTFVEPLKAAYENDGKDRVLWFKNWSALQSVGGLEHFHCFVRGADEGLLNQWTGEGKRVMM